MLLLLSGCIGTREPARDAAGGAVTALERAARAEDVALITRDAAEGLIEGTALGAYELGRNDRLGPTLAHVGDGLRTKELRAAVYDLSRDVGAGLLDGVQDGAGLWLTILVLTAGSLATIVLAGLQSAQLKTKE